MAPSSGLCSILRTQPTRIFFNLNSIPASRRPFSLSSWSDRLVDPANKVQSYISRSNDPYLNLSIEEYIMRKSPPDSHILFLYVNRPCIVIGRNQNPWLEVNLSALDGKTRIDSSLPAIGSVDLVRRRSGGGAVFHDSGNLNWSVVCPRNDFTRDKHAEMVVRALRKLGVDRARVNARHDIVLDQGPVKMESNPEDTHSTPYMVPDEAYTDDDPRPLKVSGSAYKMISARALHHATTLLSSPNVKHISSYLRSPAKAHITAKGVASVSSPVDNIGVDMEKFKGVLQREFSDAYGEVKVQTVGEELLENEKIKSGYRELRTPEFRISLQPGSEVEMIVRHGTISGVDFSDVVVEHSQAQSIRKALVGKKLHEIQHWEAFLKGHLSSWGEVEANLALQLQDYLPTPKLFET